MRLQVVGSVPEARAAALDSATASQTITEQVFRDADAGGWRLVDVIEQDEYTLDLVFDAGDATWLVYDTT